MSVHAMDISAYQGKDSGFFEVSSTHSFSNSQTRINEGRTQWIETLERRLTELMALSRGWDGYEGRPVRVDCVVFAARLLETLYRTSIGLPSLVPGGDGTLQIEWHENGYDLEIDILGPYKVVASRFDHRTQEIQELELRTDYSEIATWVSELDPVIGLAASRH